MHKDKYKMQFSNDFEIHDKVKGSCSINEDVFFLIEP